MKKILIALALVLTLCLTSCVETFHGNIGVVSNIELRQGYNGQPPKYKYTVTVKHTSDGCDRYKMLTNKLYNVGDTVEIKLKQ